MAKVKLTAKRKKIIVSTGVSLFVAVGALAVMELAPFGGPEGPAKLSTGDTQNEATQRAYSGDVDGAMQVYREQIDLSGSDEERRDLLEVKALFAYDKGRLDEALKAAEQANSLESRMSTWLLLAEIHEARGDNEQAASYYGKAVEASSENNFEKESWEQKIKELLS